MFQLFGAHNKRIHELEQQLVAERSRSEWAMKQLDIRNAENAELSIKLDVIVKECYEAQRTANELTERIKSERVEFATQAGLRLAFVHNIATLVNAYKTQGVKLQNNKQLQKDLAAAEKIITDINALLEGK